jgi:hypothetical protein
MQITLVQLAAQGRVAFEASKVGVDRVFEPTNMLFSTSIDGNTGEASIYPKGNFPFGNDKSSWQ